MGEISELAAAIAGHRCCLFAGSGLTAETGGTTWDGLISYLKDRFGYESPLRESFQILSDMGRKVGPEILYNAIRDRLTDARIGLHADKLMDLPWFSVFTTNYDLALETSLRTHNPLTIRTIVTGEEFTLAGVQSELLCVKLMGSLDIPYKLPGSMAIDTGDLALAKERRARMFNILASHAAYLSFLFIGYSFADGLFVETLERLIKATGRPANGCYALFRNPPDEERNYLLREYGVKVLVEHLSSFADKLSYQVHLRNPDDLTLKRIPLGNDVVTVDARKVSAFLSSYNPVLFEDLESVVPPNLFFKGVTSSFKPFKQGWHFPRKEVQNIVDAALERSSNDGAPCTIRVSGNPGTGRTFAILAAVIRLIIENRAVAIKIPNYTANPFPSSEPLSIFMQEIRQNAERVGVNPPERVVFWSEFPLEVYDLSQFARLAKEFEEYPLCLIAEDIAVAYVGSHEKIVSVGLGAELSEEEKNRLVQYILTTTRVHRFPELSAEEIEKIVKDEKFFLPIMYRALDPAKRSINEIIGNHWREIIDPRVSACILLAAIPSSIEMEVPVAVLRKALSLQAAADLSYREAFDIIDRASVFLKQALDLRTNPLVSIYHSLVAKQILSLASPSKIRESVLSIAKTVDLRSRIEAEFAGNIFIRRGVNWEPAPYLSRPFDDDVVGEALTEIKCRQPARPILHHLARFYAKKDSKDDRILPLLHEALAEPLEAYAIEERRENVLTTLGKAKWDQNKEHLLELPRESVEISEIMEMLVRARSGMTPNTHPYDIQARILKELAQNADNNFLKMQVLKEATEVLTDGLQVCVDDPDGRDRLKSRLIEVAHEISESDAEASAEQMLISKNDGTGFYTLALIKYNDNQTEPARQFLERALSAANYPPRALALKIEMLLSEANTDYKKLSELSDRLKGLPDFRDNWRSAYHRGVISAITGRYADALYYFKASYRQAPRLLQRSVQFFWMEGGRRKKLTGKIGRTLTEREGTVYAHGISGWDDNIFFDPRRQEKRSELRTGLFVDFELGFSPRGPIAFDVRLHQQTS